MNKNNYIFLDIDGVLQIYDAIHLVDGKYFTANDEEVKKDKVFIIEAPHWHTMPDSENFAYAFNIENVLNLSSLHKEKKADIVLSSYWRYSSKKNVLLDKLFEYGIKIKGETKGASTIRPLDFMKFSKMNNVAAIREMEIEEYIDRLKIENYVVIDDLDMTNKFKERMVHTQFYRGFNKSKLKQAMSIL